MLLRVIATVIIVVLWGLGYAVLTSTHTILASHAAGLQFQNSDVAAVVSQTSLYSLSKMVLIPSIIAIIALLLVWVPYIKRTWLAAAVLTLALSTSPAFAYYDKYDYAEAYTILPNESAFWIPDTGANKDSQVQYDSESYLESSKVAVKRFVVPHTHLQGSGSFFDFYVPSGRLIIVDRTTYSREWVASAERGTSKGDESFPCQSKEGLTITTGVSIGVEVKETNAAKYLYHFGVVSPTGTRNDPQVIFASVYYSRKVADVMDDIGRKKVQTLVCGEIASRSFDAANADANVIMDNVRKAATDYFASVGITLDFIGWADTFTFDHAVQDAIDRRYIAQQDKEIASLLTPYATTIQALAAADALRSFGQHTDGKLPTTIVGLPPQVGTLLGTLLQSGPQQAK